MSDVKGVLADLLQRGVALWVKDGKVGYRAPEEVPTSFLRQTLSKHKAEIIATLDEGKRYLLPSFAQERLWFLAQLEPDDPSYIVPAAVRLVGSLDVQAFERSINEIVSRHEALRTTFENVNGLPVQVIAPSQVVQLPIVDLQRTPGAERWSLIQRMAKEEAWLPFDLARGPLLRIKLLRLAENEHVCLASLHHIISDGWSAGVFMRELALLYGAFCADRPSPLPALSLQYADFAQWQRQWLQGRVFEEQLAYWTRHLGGTLPLLVLPADHQPPAVRTWQGACHDLSLSTSLSEALRDLSKREGVTLFMTLLAAFATLLYRYTGQEDVIIGSPIANRNRVEIEGLIGFFLNTLVLRNDLSGDPRFLDLLASVRQVTLKAYEHQDLPFERLIRELQPERDLDSTPLFRVMLVLQTPAPELELPGLTLQPLKFERGIAQTDLMLDLSDKPEGIEGILEYSADIFDAATIERMARHFHVLLEGIVDDPTRHLSELPLLTEAERHRMLVAWNEAGSECPGDKCLHDLFEEQAGRTPDAVAVVFQDQHLTYGALNERAGRLACYLCDLGVRPEVQVGIYVEPSLAMVVGILGILKAGGAYVPLDVSYPGERLALMLAETRVAVLLTQERLRERLRDQDATLICLDWDWEKVSRVSAKSVRSGARPDNLAYTIFTSGSTGEPKGILATHEAAASRCIALSKKFRLEPDDRVLQFAAISFDVSVEELYPTWIAGATLCLLADRMVAPNWELTRLVDDEKLTVLNLPSSFWHEWVLELGDSGGHVPRSLRTMVVGSERVSPERFANWRAMDTGHVGWINAYGPTETTVSCVHYGPGDVEGVKGRSEVPVGRPLDDTKVYLLDARLQPVPLLVPGEICISGLGLARGYLNRPALTAERFIPDPFGDEPGARLYRSGDLGRYLPDANVEFLGRADHQVKIRGFRVEPQEIETILGRHPNVRDAAVVVRADTSADTRLIACIVPNWQAERKTDEERELELTQEIKSYLGRYVPGYMMPSAFVVLEAMPTTPTGKIDRLALSSLDHVEVEMVRDSIPPRTPTEHVLADIWTDVLELESIGVEDDFFRLGGHSLLAARVASRVREAFRIELPLRSVLETRTIASLAGYIDSVNWAARGPQRSVVATGDDLEEGEL